MSRRDEQINEHLYRLWSLIHGTPTGVNGGSAASSIQPDARIIAHLKSNMEKLTRHLKGSFFLSNDSSPKTSEGEDQWEVSQDADDTTPPESRSNLPHNTKTACREEDPTRLVRITSIKSLITGRWRMTPAHPYSNLQRLHKKAKWPLVVSEFWKNFQFSQVCLRRESGRKLSLRFLDCPKLQLIFTIASRRDAKPRDVQVEYIGGTSLSSSLRLQMDIAHQLQQSFRSKNMKYVCTVRRDSTGMKLRMVMDGDNRRVLRQSVERHFWACGENKMLCRVTLEEEKQNDEIVSKRRSSSKSRMYGRMSPSKSAKTRYNKRSSSKNNKSISLIKSVSYSDEGSYKQRSSSSRGSSSDSASELRFWQRVCVAMEEYRRVPSS